MIRLIADDLTGALDTAAAFAHGGPVGGPVGGPFGGPVRVALSPATAPVGWRGGLAINTGNRDRSSNAARARAAAAAAAHLSPDALAFCKIDSVLRGAPAIDIAAAAAALAPARIVIAPAFPAQGRITRDGRQWRREGEGWTALDPPLARLAPDGLARLAPHEPVRLWAAGAAPPQGFGAGVHVCDAETDADLALIAEAAAHGAARTTLLVGAAGLAAAMAALAPGGGAATWSPERSGSALSGPALMVFATPHPVTRGQLAALEAAGLARALPLDDAAARASAMLALGRPALLDLSHAGDGMDRRAAGRAVGALLAQVAGMAPPPWLMIGGGATLAALLRRLRATALDIDGLLTPGVAQARIVGGAWSGVTLVAKSGGFGDPGLLARLLRGAWPITPPQAR